MTTPTTPPPAPLYGPADYVSALRYIAAMVDLTAHTVAPRREWVQALLVVEQQGAQHDGDA